MPETKLAPGEPVETQNKLTFEFLPAFARWILDNRLETYVKLQLELSRKEDIPILRLFRHFTDEQLVEMGMQGGSELLLALAENRAEEYIQMSITRWTSNQLEMIDKFAVLAEDIALVTLVRRQTFRTLLEEFTPDIRRFRSTMVDVDRFTTASDAAFFNCYLQIHQEKLQQANRLLEQKTETLLESQQIAKMGSFYWDLEGKGRSELSPATLAIFELEQTSGFENFLKDVHPDDRELLRQSIDDAVKKNEVFDCEYRYTRNGGMKKIWSRGVLILENDRPVAIRGTVMDVSDRHALLEKLGEKADLLEQKNLELERINQELQSFNYAASHDLQEPLRKILLFINRIFEDGLAESPELSRYLQKISTSASRMQRLIEDLLVFSQAGSRDNAVEEVELSSLLTEARLTLSHRIEETQARISNSLLPKVRVVPFQFQQVFTNILSNALKYRKEDAAPEIWIESGFVSENEPGLTPGHADFLRISVRDNGIGFDTQFSDRLFELFSRLHSREKFSGTGIGLALCKKIIQNHQGFIRAESDGQSGSTFHIYLPRERVVS